MEDPEGFANKIIGVMKHPSLSKELATQLLSMVLFLNFFF
jgi:hypothetical protein